MKENLEHRRKKKNYMKPGEPAFKPITDEYIRSMVGITGTKGKLLKALMREKSKERAR